MSFFTTLAQQSTAALAGTITNKSGEVLPQATIRLTNRQTVLTDIHGRYTITHLAPGSYTITIHTSKSGFMAQLNTFQNYSDNDYNVYVDILEDFGTGRTRAGWARRFHDTYHNETVIATAGMIDKPQTSCIH